jgi:hypothetical protein
MHLARTGPRRVPIRAAAISSAAGVLFAVACNEPAGTGGLRLGQLAVRPVFSPATAAGLFNLAVDRVRITILRPPAQVALDTAVFFPSGASQLEVRLKVPLATPRELFTVTLQLFAGPTLLFTGTRSVEISEAVSVAPPIPLQYVGPGRELTTLRIEPRDSVLMPGSRFTFLVGGWAGDRPIEAFYVAWRTSNPAVATVDPKGTLQAPQGRGQVFLHAVTPTGVRDSTRVSFAPPPTVMLLVGGNEQTGTAGQALPLPLRVQVKAADDLGVPGVRVRFRSFSGGSVSDSIVITDAEGYAETFAALGPTVGRQGFEAEVPLLNSISFLATALPGPPSVVKALAGSNQTGTVGRLLPRSLVAQVTDASGNPIPHVPITWTVISGGGTLSTTSAVTNLSGITFADWTLGPTPTLNVARVTITDRAVFADFHATATPGAPNTLDVMAGAGQTDTVAAVVNPLAVLVRDEFGNPVPGATVDWSADRPGGVFSVTTTTTDVTGRSQVSYRLPTTSGPVSVRARVRGTQLAVAFPLTATPASPAVLVSVSGNGQAAAPGTPLAPFSVRVTDQFANPVGGATVSWQVIEGDGSLSAGQTESDAAGLASVIYTLGPTPGQQRVRATLPSGAAVVFNATATSP